jgi:putative ABC transport system permease protein
MRIIRRTLARLRTLAYRRQQDRRLAEEFETHLAMQTEDNLRAGMSADEARREALLASGGLPQATDAYREQRRLPFVETTLADVRFGLRMIARAPGFSAVVVLTLAIGIGANTAIYSLSRAVLTPLAIDSPSRVVFVWTDNATRGWRKFPASIPDFEEWAASGLFEKIGAFNGKGFNVRVGERTDRVEGMQITGDGMDVFGVAPALGRTFRAQDATGGHDHVAVLTHTVWQSRFGADPSIVGRQIVIDGSLHEVVGVLPASFPQLGHEEIYTPLVLSGPAAADRRQRNVNVVGRLVAGVRLQTAQQQIDVISRRLAEAFPGSNGQFAARLQPVEEAFVEDSHVILTILFGAVGLVLLIACANVANLLLARGVARGREMALRAALGASHWRLGRQLITEHVLLGAFAGAIALLPAMAVMRFVASFQLDQLPNANLVRLSLPVLAFNVALSLVASVAFGAVPAWQAWQVDLQRGLRAAIGSAAGTIHHRLRGAFVVVEFALAIVLLVGAGLLIRSFLQMRSSDPGYDPSHVLTMRVALNEARYGTANAQLAYYHRVLDRLRSLPGIDGASAADEIPTMDNYSMAGLRTSDERSERPEDRQVVLYASVMSDYFQVMRVPLLQGRAFVDDDRDGTAPVAIVDRSTAERNWPGETPIGKWLKLGGDQPRREVVGVAADVEEGPLITLLKGRTGQVYLPLPQAPKAALAIVVRTHGDPALLAPAIRDAAHTVDADQPLFQIRTLIDARADERATHRLATTLLATFGGIALLMATLGIYGVVANNVGERTREFGIRLALGAAPADVLSVVFRNAVTLMVTGTAIGLAFAFVLTRVVTSLLVGIPPTDPVTFMAVVVLLGLLGLIASYIPARRATRVDPTIALRAE